MNTATEISSTTQKFLEIYDVVNDFLILKDGSTALVITVNAMNFGLLAEEEQDAIIYAYAGLLNSLNYPIQIVVKSQTKDVSNYLHLLDDEMAKSTSATKKKWIQRYREFVSNLIRERNVLDKKFYVVVPATALEMGLLPPSTVVPGVQQPDLSSVERSVILDKAKEILIPKRDHLLSQFGRIGLYARQVTTQEIIQLFYASYNPEAAEGQQITDTSSYTTPLVSASVSQGGLMNDMPTTPGTPTPPAAPNQVAAPVNPQPVQPQVETPQPTVETQVPTTPAMPQAPVEPTMPAAAPNMEPQTTPTPSPTVATITPPSESPVTPTPSIAEAPQINPPTVGAETPEVSGVPTPTPAVEPPTVETTSPQSVEPTPTPTPTPNDGVDLSAQSAIDSAAQEVTINPAAANPGAPLPTPSMPPTPAPSAPPTGEAPAKKDQPTT